MKITPVLISSLIIFSQVVEDLPTKAVVQVEVIKRGVLFDLKAPEKSIDQIMKEAGWK